MSSNKRNTPRNISEQEDKSASKNTPPTDYKIPVIKINPSKTSGDESNDDPAKKQPLESLEFTKFEDLPDGCTCTTVCSCPVEGSSNENRNESFDSTQGQPPSPNDPSDVDGYESDLDTGIPKESQKEEEQQSKYNQQNESQEEFVERHQQAKSASPKYIIIDKANETNDAVNPEVAQSSNEEQNKEVFRNKALSSDENIIDNTNPRTRQDVTESRPSKINESESDVIIEDTQDGEDTLTENNKSLTSSPDPIFESTRVEGLGKRYSFLNCIIYCL